MIQSSTLSDFLVDRNAPAARYRPRVTAAPSTHRQSATNPGLTRITFEIYTEHAPAFRSAVEQLKNDIGGQLEKKQPYDKDTAYVAASICVSKLLAATVAVVPKADPAYNL
jgi:hypothetical protein